jgi:hypothetical protein
MCKFIRLGFFLLQSNDFFLIVFSLGSKLETDQASQPSALPYPPNVA